MKVIHSFGDETISNDIERPVSFLLTNRMGDYLSFPSSNEILSRYHGWFITLGDSFYKIIESIELVGSDSSAPPLNELKNNFTDVEHKRSGGIREHFSLHQKTHVFTYELNKRASIALCFDIRKSYDNPEMGRIYDIQEHDGLLILSYHYGSEDPLYVVIAYPDGDHSLSGEWIGRHYPFDERRNSPPFVKYVYRGVIIRGRVIVCSADTDKNAAIEAVRRAVKEKHAIISQQKDWLRESDLAPRHIQDAEIKMAYRCATHSLYGLVLARHNRKGIYAGFPWFFQFWTRDEALSLGALADERFPGAKKILLSRLEAIDDSGRMLNKVPTGDGTAADAAGWFFKRIGDHIEQFDAQERVLIADKLMKTIAKMRASREYRYLIYNSWGETWMDTTSRAGACIEIQALQLAMYDLAVRLNGGDRLRELRDNLSKRVRERFWNGETLTDELNETTNRPNAFLAAYAYPDLLNKEEWATCFENILKSLWMDWGGLATIDRENPYFTSWHTGENPKSYHSGDSWFYLNNLAALVLFRCDKKRFAKYIYRMIKASTEEILWHGAIGHHGELSSAAEFTSEGSWSQAWSNAMYIEAINELIKNPAVDITNA